MSVTRRIFIRLGFTHDGFPQDIDRKADFLCLALAQCPYDLVRISSGDKLAHHFGDVPAQHRSAYPRSKAGQVNANANERVETVVAIAKIFFEMLNNLT